MFPLDWNTRPQRVRHSLLSPSLEPEIRLLSFGLPLLEQEASLPSFLWSPSLEPDAHLFCLLSLKPDTHLLSFGLPSLEPLDCDRPGVRVNAGHHGRVDPTCRQVTGHVSRVHGFREHQLPVNFRKSSTVASSVLVSQRQSGIGTKNVL